MCSAKWSKLNLSHRGEREKIIEEITSLSRRDAEYGGKEDVWTMGGKT